MLSIIRTSVNAVEGVLNIADFTHVIAAIAVGGGKTISPVVEDFDSTTFPAGDAMAFSTHADGVIEVVRNLIWAVHHAEVFAAVYAAVRTGAGSHVLITFKFFFAIQTAVDAVSVIGPVAEVVVSSQGGIFVVAFQAHARVQARYTVCFYFGFFAAVKAFVVMASLSVGNDEVPVGNLNVLTFVATNTAHAGLIAAPGKMAFPVNIPAVFANAMVAGFTITYTTIIIVVVIVTITVTFVAAVSANILVDAGATV